MTADSYASLLEQARRDGVFRHVVGAAIVRDGEVLMLARPSTEFMGGVYELPSGQIEPGEGIDEALRREVAEETGLRVSRIGKYLGSFDYRSPSGRPTRQFNFAVAVDAYSPIVLGEHEDYVWLRPDRLDGIAVSASVRAMLARLDRQP